MKMLVGLERGSQPAAKGSKGGHQQQQAVRPYKAGLTRFFPLAVALNAIALFIQEPKKGINIKNLGRTPPPKPPPPPKEPLIPQILYVWGLFALQNTGKRPA